MTTQQIWIISAPETTTKLLAVFDASWSKEKVSIDVKDKFAYLQSFKMRRFVEGSCIVSAVDGVFDGSEFDENLTELPA